MIACTERPPQDKVPLVSCSNALSERLTPDNIIADLNIASMKLWAQYPELAVFPGTVLLNDKRTGDAEYPSSPLSQPQLRSEEPGLSSAACQDGARLYPQEGTSGVVYLHACALTPSCASPGHHDSAQQPLYSVLACCCSVDICARLRLGAGCWISCEVSRNTSMHNQLNMQDLFAISFFPPLAIASLLPFTHVPACRVCLSWSCSPTLSPAGGAARRQAAAQPACSEHCSCRGRQHCQRYSQPG